MKCEKKSIECELVVAGRVRRAWGVKGQLTVDWSDGSCPTLEDGGKIFLRDKEGTLSEFVVTKDHRHGSCNIVTLKNLSSPEEARKYNGADILVGKEGLPALKEDEFYTYQLIDMKVETTEGEYLGEIKSVFSTGSNDVYVVKKGAHEILIPAIKDVVKKVDVGAGLMIVELMEGLV